MDFASLGFFNLMCRWIEVYYSEQVFWSKAKPNKTKQRKEKMVAWGSCSVIIGKGFL